eukprot:354972-Chlamydomonas_euryale.AAC.2
MGLHEPAWVCHGPAWVCMGLHGPAWACTGLHEPAWACTGLHEPAWVCHGSAWPAWTCMDLHGFVMGLHGPAWACMGLHGPAWACMDLRPLHTPKQARTPRSFACVCAGRKGEGDQCARCAAAMQGCVERKRLVVWSVRIGLCGADALGCMELWSWHACARSFRTTVLVPGTVAAAATVAAVATFIVLGR